MADVVTSVSYFMSLALVFMESRSSKGASSSYA